MGDLQGEEDDRNSTNRRSYVLDIYPIHGYYFGSREARPVKDDCLSDRVLRMKSNYDVRGLRVCVEAVLVVELFKHPHLLLLQVRNSIFKLPGGRLRPGESDIAGLKRKLAKLSVSQDGNVTEWEVEECLGRWWRPGFETSFYPYLPPDMKTPKECKKIFLVKLPVSRSFMVPKNEKMLAIPLCEIHDNPKKYGPIISRIPQMLSRFSFNIVDLES